MPSKVGKPPYDPNVGEAYRSGHTLVYRSSTWAFNPTLTKDNFAEQFAKNPRKAMNEYGSVKPQAIEAFCKDADLVDSRANTKRLSPIREDGTFEDWFLPELDVPYFFHGDLGETRDAAGFCMGHPDRVTKRVIIDLMLEFVPPPGGSLQYERFKQLILTLRKRGFFFEKVTFDAWQSRSSMQALTNRGIAASWYSVDKNTEAYDTLLELLLMNKLDFYPHPVFGWEFSNLQYIGGKVDHKTDTAKDLTDAIAAVAFHCVDSGLMDGYNVHSMGVPVTQNMEAAVQSFRQEGGRLIPINPAPRPLDANEEEGGEDEDGSVPAVFTTM